jgi:hypothetical protein
MPADARRAVLPGYAQRAPYSIDEQHARKSTPAGWLLHRSTNHRCDNRQTAPPAQATLRSPRNLQTRADLPFPPLVTTRLR